MADHEYARITITRLISEDGEDIIGVESTDEMTVFEGAGMLAMATHAWHETNGFRDLPDAGDED